MGSPAGSHFRASCPCRSACCSSFGGQIMPAAVASCFLLTVLVSPQIRALSWGLSEEGKYLRPLKRLLAWETSRKSMWTLRALPGVRCLHNSGHLCHQPQFTEPLLCAPLYTLIPLPPQASYRLQGYRLWPCSGPQAGAISI